MPSRIYPDNNATTALDVRVLKAMQEEFARGPANPSSIHKEGKDAKFRLQQAREKIARYFKVKPQEILFTSGGTEGVNMILKGVFSNLKGHLITSELDHSCLYKTAQDLQSRGVEVTFLNPGAWGACRVEDVKAAFETHTKLVFLSAVNSETGVMADYEAIAKICFERGVPCVIDGVALLGKEQFEFSPLLAGACFSAHKFHGPKGIGFNIIRKSLQITPLLTGGEQEYQLRAGTENLPGILGLAEAIGLLDELPHFVEHIKHLRSTFEALLKASIPSIRINGEGPRASNVANVTFPDVDGELLLTLLDQAGVSTSLGSACASGAIEPSRVLTKMGLSRHLASSSLRFSFSRYNTEDEVYQTISILKNIIAKIK